MSVLIRGMEIPKNCFECPWRCKVDPENLLCRISGEYFEETFSGTIQNRHKSCPLVPVQTPHGDLIGREWLVDIALHLMNTAKNDDIANGVKWILQYIIESPTIIPAEEGET